MESLLCAALCLPCFLTVNLQSQKRRFHLCCQRNKYILILAGYKEFDEKPLSASDITAIAESTVNQLLHKDDSRGYYDDRRRRRSRERSRERSYDRSRDRCDRSTERSRSRRDRR